jgi:GxxExxY protein
MDADDQNFPESDLTRTIIGAAMTVLNAIRPGHDEKIYENALVVELTEQRIHCDQQARFPVNYKGHVVGTLVPDLIVEGRVIVDTKVVAAFNESHIAQMLGYLAITGLPVALLLNFKNSRLTWKRVTRSLSA